MTSPHAHERRLSSNHSRADAVTISTAMMLHGVEDADFSLVVDVGFASDFVGVGEAIHAQHRVQSAVHAQPVIESLRW